MSYMNEDSKNLQPEPKIDEQEIQIIFIITRKGNFYALAETAAQALSLCSEGDDIGLFNCLTHEGISFVRE